MTSGKAEKSDIGCLCAARRKKRQLSEPYVNNNQRPLAALENVRVEKLPARFDRGKSLCITASSLPNCQRWAVNLLCGKNHSDDIAFHFNPRLLQHYIVRNTRIKGVWGFEEGLTTGRFEIKHGEEFKLKIFATDDEFFVSYNDKHICSYKHRLPVNSITYVEIIGMVDIYKIEMNDFDMYPIDQRDLYIVKEIGKTNTNGRKMEVPISALLPEKLQEDWQLEIRGVPKILCQLFSISLKSEVYIWPPCTIALQINAHFGNNMLVRNAFIDNKWGMEERVGGFKFLPATPFSLWIRRSMKKYSIWVNEKLQAEFTYRCNPDLVTSVYIQGDVYINDISINKDPETYF